MDESLLKKQAKPPNPRATANPLSALTFSWILGLFWVGNKRPLEISDLYAPLKEHRSNSLGDKYERAWNSEIERSKRRHKYKPSLLKVIAKVFGWEIAMYGLVLGTVEIGIRLTQPIFLGYLIRYFSERQTGTTAEEDRVTIREAYAAAAGVVFCSAMDIVIQHPYVMAVLHIGMKMHVGCCSLIYRKVLKLSKTALGETAIGEVVNLLSNDVSRFEYFILFIHYLWVGPLQTVIVTYFLWREIGFAAVVGVATLLLVIPMQLWLGKLSCSLRMQTAIKTDKRLRLMNEIISGIQVIKMYTWEKPFANLVSKARRKEIDVILKTSYIKAILLSFFVFHTRVALFASIFFYVLQGGSINAEKVFVVASFYNVLRTSMTLFFPQSIGNWAEVMVSIKRLETFLMYDEALNLLPNKWSNKEIPNGLSVNNEKASKLDSTDIMSSNDGMEMTNCNSGGISISGVTAKWTPDLPTLSNINIKVPKGQLAAVIGTVGSGKSSLLHMILQELPLTDGNLSVEGRVSYASQEPWLFAGSVRQNILFGEPYEKTRYREVTRVCALLPDFELMQYGDKTIVGDRGVSLSGGQRARINLARAVYKKADVYLLDDPLSAVDTHVGKHLFQDCIVGYLRNKTRVLVTHQLQYLNDLEHIVMLCNGKIVAQGNYGSLQKSGENFAKLLQSSLAEKSETEEQLGTSLIKKHSSQQSVASSLDENAWSNKQSEEMAEMQVVGNVGLDVYKAYFRATGTGCMLLLCGALCVLAQLLASGSDYWITYWVNTEENVDLSGSPTRTASTNVSTLAPISNNVFNDTIVSGSDGMRNDTDSNVVTEHLSFVIWSLPWFELQLDRQMFINIFCVLTVATVVITLVRTFMVYGMCVTASMNLHDSMFSSITRATMRFFNVNSSGRILNRFSKDMGSIDESLPVSIIDCVQIGLALIGIIAIVAYVNYWLLFPTFFIALLFYYLRDFFLMTSRSIKRLEGVTRSPIFSHLSATLHGLSTIRAFKAQNILEKEFDNHQDLHTSAWYIFLSTNHAFGFWLDFFCVVYISLVTLSFLIMDDAEILGGSVGLAITQSLALTGMFQWGMRQTAELENLMTSVERVVEYSNLEKEPPLESPPDKKPPESWPQEGKVEFSHVFLQYGPHEPPVLKNVTFTAEPGEKIGIVGRTGAGKSSLLSALYRLTDIEGEIYIDDVPTSQLGLHDMRSKISIIPQEPVLFSGTMRKNLDPFDQFSDNVLWDALEQVELKDLIKELPGGLNAKVLESGSNLSVGERQLVCLARAIVRNNKILVLDEATANVDPQTDSFIQDTIRKKFANCTMLTIAHRLHTVMDSDRVLVMNAGSVVEFNRPHLLLQNKDGFLYKMVEQTGKTTAETLFRIAEENYKQYIDDD